MWVALDSFAAELLTRDLDPDLAVLPTSSDAAGTLMICALVMNGFWLVGST